MHGSVSYISCSNFNSLEAPLNCSVPQSQRLLIHPTPTAHTTLPYVPGHVSKRTVARAVENLPLSIQTLTIYRSYGRIRGACLPVEVVQFAIPILLFRRACTDCCYLKSLHLVIFRFILVYLN